MARTLLLGGQRRSARRRAREGSWAARPAPRRMVARVERLGVAARPDQLGGGRANPRPDQVGPTLLGGRRRDQVGRGHQVGRGDQVGQTPLGGRRRDQVGQTPLGGRRRDQVGRGQLGGRRREQVAPGLVVARGARAGRTRGVGRRLRVGGTLLVGRRRNQIGQTRTVARRGRVTWVLRLGRRVQAGRRPGVGRRDRVRWTLPGGRPDLVGRARSDGSMARIAHRASVPGAVRARPGQRRGPAVRVVGIQACGPGVRAPQGPTARPVDRRERERVAVVDRLGRMAGAARAPQPQQERAHDRRRATRGRHHAGAGRATRAAARSVPRVRAGIRVRMPGSCVGGRCRDARSEWHRGGSRHR